MTPEGKTAAIILSLVGMGIGGYLIYKYSKTLTTTTQSVIPVKISSKCDNTANGAQITVGWNAFTGASAYQVVHEDGTILASTTAPTVQVTVDDVYIGPWTIYIQALGSSGQILVTGPKRTLNVCALSDDPNCSWVCNQEPQWCGANCTG